MNLLKFQYPVGAGCFLLPHESRYNQQSQGVILQRRSTINDQNCHKKTVWFWSGTRFTKYFEQKVRQKNLCSVTNDAWDVKSEYSRLFLYLAIQEESSVTVPVPCTGRFSTSFGLPCKHRLKEYLSTDEPIPLASIHRPTMAFGCPRGWWIWSSSSIIT